MALLSVANTLRKGEPAVGLGPYRSEGAPPDGWYSGVAEKGALAVDTTTGAQYSNTGTKPSPVWTAAGGGSGSGRVLIATQTLSVDADYVDFTSIPQLGRVLRLDYVARVTYANTNNYLNFTANGDAGANYEWQYTVFNNATFQSGGEFHGYSGVALCGMVNGGNSPANSWGTGYVRWLAYAASGVRKAFEGDGFAKDADTTPGFTEMRTVGEWLGTDPITSLRILPYGSTQFLAGSRFTLSYETVG